MKSLAWIEAENNRMTTKQTTLGPDAPIDVARLIESRLLVQANSGGGKSWALRRLLEQTYAHVPQIVIDVEGEFHTLREKFDYVLAGQKGGDCPADTKSAAMLARRLLELNVSAIVDIYELGANRARFVRLFLDALVNAPRELWHPTLVVIDEAHMFAPESGHAESADAVKDLMTRGRKRGFCGVLATQRISKLHKDAAAECNNKLIGRSSLDIDMKRAGAELGFTTREDLQKLRTLAPGSFYAFGPALSDEVRLVTIGAVATTHPKAGERAAAPTPPRDKVKRVLAQLADLPREAEEEARTVGEWKAKAKALELEVRKAKSAQPVAEVKTVEKAVIKAADINALTKLVSRVEDLGVKFDGAIQDLRNKADEIGRAIWATVHPTPFKISPQTGRSSETAGRARPVARSTAAVTSQVRNASVSGVAAGETALLKLGGGLERILVALAQHPEGLTDRQVGMFAGLSSKGGTYSTYVSRARQAGYLVDRGRGERAITEAGLAALGSFEPLPTGAELSRYWLREVGGGEARILQVLLDAGRGVEVDSKTIAERAGISAAGGTFSTYISRLRTRELITGSRGVFAASEELFE